MVDIFKFYYMYSILCTCYIAQIHCNQSSISNVDGIEEVFSLFYSINCALCISGTSLYEIVSDYPVLLFSFYHPNAYALQHAFLLFYFVCLLSSPPLDTKYRKRDALSCYSLLPSTCTHDTCSTNFIGQFYTGMNV